MEGKNEYNQWKLYELVARREGMVIIHHTAKVPDVSTTHWSVVWVAFGAGVVGAAHIGKLPPALPELRIELEASLVMAGWIASMISATGFALGLVAGAIADRLGQRRVLMFGLFSLGIGSLIGALAPSGEVMLLARFIEGIGFTSTTVSGATMIARVTSDKDRKWALGVWAAYMPLGFASMMLFGAIILDHFDWRTLWGVGCLISFLWIFVVLIVTKDWHHDRPNQSATGSVLSNVVSSFGQVGALLVAGSYALYATQHIAMMSWLPTYLQEVHNSSTLIAASIPAMVLLFNAGGNYLAAWAMGRDFPIWLLLTLGSGGMAITEIAIFSGFLPDTFKLIVAFAFGVAGGLIPASALAAAPVYAKSPALIGSMSGIMVMATNTGQLFGPPALAAARESTGSWEGTLWLLLTLATIATILSILSRPMENRTHKF